MSRHRDRVKEPLLFISYFCGIKGNCPAEWADDKLRGLKKLGHEIIVLTGYSSEVIDSSDLRYVRVPSLSWRDFNTELKQRELSLRQASWSCWLLAPLAFTLGRLLDLWLQKVTNGITAGRWTWFLTALPVGLWLRWRYSTKVIFATGGPTAAQLVGAVLAKMTRSKYYAEFQDPVVGVTMTRSQATRQLSARFESFIVNAATKVVFVTKRAAELAKVRNQEFSQRIHAIYPGSWRFIDSCPQAKLDGSNSIELLHLGTLYGSRNLDLLFRALDELRAENFAQAQHVKVTNLGAVYCDTAPIYRQRDDFTELETMGRMAALQRASQANCLLLVQHTDARSVETIPYKTYDYLNLGLPIFGIINNPELQELLEQQGGIVAAADDLAGMKLALRSMLMKLEEAVDVAKATPQPSERQHDFDICRQILQVLQ